MRWYSHFLWAPSDDDATVNAARYSEVITSLLLLLLLLLLPHDDDNSEIIGSSGNSEANEVIARVKTSSEIVTLT